MPLKTISKQLLSKIPQFDPEHRIKVLCVDDEPSILNVMQRGLDDDYEIFTATGGTEGLKILDAHRDIIVILSDQKMPDMNGTDFLEKSQKIVPDAIRIMVSAYSDVSVMMDAINKGFIYKFILKPFELETLRVNIKRASEHYFHKKAFEIAYQELEKAQKQLIQAEKMTTLGKLMSAVGHELGNPVSNMHQASILAKHEWTLLKVLFDRTLKAGSFEDLQRITEWVHQNNLEFTITEFESILNTMQNASDLARDIIQDIRGFSRLDDAEWTDVSIIDQIERAINLLKNKYKYAVRFHRDYQQVTRIKGLPGPLTQVMLNLIYNAAQSIKEQGNIWIKTWQENGAIKISIKDDGSGISAENLPRIFESGFTTKSEEEGTGLGLTISYGIIEKHGGTIDVWSVVGKGSEFVITLPNQSAK